MLPGHWSTKGHETKLIMTISCSKGRLWEIRIPNLKLMITRSKINLREALHTLKLIKQIINPRKRIFILYGHFVQLTIINAHTKGTIFLHMNNMGAPYRDMLGHIKPLSKRSINFSLSFSTPSEPFYKKESKLEECLQ